MGHGPKTWALQYVNLSLEDAFESLEGKAQIGQYLLAVDLGRYISRVNVISHIGWGGEQEQNTLYKSVTRFKALRENPKGKSKKDNIC